MCLDYGWNVVGVILQTQVAELQAQQTAQAAEFEAKRLAQEEAQRREMEAYQQHSQRQMQDMAAFFRGLQIPGVTLPPVPSSLLAPPPFPITNPQGTPVSICGCLLLWLGRPS